MSKEFQLCKVVPNRTNVSGELIFLLFCFCSFDWTHRYVSWELCLNFIQYQGIAFLVTFISFHILSFPDIVNGLTNVSGLTTLKTMVHRKLWRCSQLWFSFGKGRGYRKVCSYCFCLWWKYLVGDAVLILIFISDELCVVILLFWH